MPSLGLSGWFLAATIILGSLFRIALTHGEAGLAMHAFTTWLLMLLIECAIQSLDEEAEQLRIKRLAFQEEEEA